jgi:hypothetical protein
MEDAAVKSCKNLWGAIVSETDPDANHNKSCSAYVSVNEPRLTESTPNLPL